jgi:hypothetical protein
MLHLMIHWVLAPIGRNISSLQVTSAASNFVQQEEVAKKGGRGRERKTSVAKVLKQNSAQRCEFVSGPKVPIN